MITAEQRRQVGRKVSVGVPAGAITTIVIFIWQKYSTAEFTLEEVILLQGAIQTIATFIVQYFTRERMRRTDQREPEDSPDDQPA